MNRSSINYVYIALSYNPNKNCLKDALLKCGQKFILNIKIAITVTIVAETRDHLHFAFVNY